MALSHLALKSRDLETTRRFYVEVLGLREPKTTGVKVVGRPNGYTVELYAD